MALALGLYFVSAVIFYAVGYFTAQEQPTMLRLVEESPESNQVAA
ncbi:hypothetical protein QPK87_05020 [Kamptonema cortianum]|nr:hypothetical protein [Kamptonema cortianum]